MAVFEKELVEQQSSCLLSLLVVVWLSLDDQEMKSDRMMGKKRKFERIKKARGQQNKTTTN